MATIRLNLVTSLDAATATRMEQHSTGRQALTSMSNFLVAFASGARGRSAGSAVSYGVSVDDNATAAAGTITFASASSADTVTVGATTLSASSSTTDATHFKVGVSNTADAAALATCINANTTLSQYVTATSANAVCTITAKGTVTPAVLGNAIILSSSNGGRLAIAAFSGGANDATAVTYTF